MIYKNILETDLFNQVYLLTRDEVKFMPLGIKRQVITMWDFLQPYRFLRKRLANYNVPVKNFASYEKIYFATANTTAANMIKINPSAELILFEDGTGSYSGNIIRQAVGRLHLMFARVFHVGVYICRPTKLLVNNVNMCKSNVVPEEKILPLPKLSDKFIEFCNKIFGIYAEREKNNICWFSQPVAYLPDAVETRNIIARSLYPYKEKVIVRMHPRELDYDYYRDFNIDMGDDMWELKILNADVDKMILIAPFSTAQVTPKLIFNLEPTLIFVHEFSFLKSMGRVHDVEIFISDLKKSYRNPEKIYTPHTPEEFAEILKQLIH